MTRTVGAAVMAAMLVLAATAPAAAQSPTPGGLPAEVALLNTRQIDFTSAVNGHAYRIQVSLPRVPPPAAGYRVLYVLDGYNYFATAADAVRANGNAPDVVVVGIGYPFTREWAYGVLDRHVPSGPNRPPSEVTAISAAVGMERGYDLTLPATEAELAAQALPTGPKQLASDVGGVDDLLKIIETEIKPKVAALTKVDASNQVLFGHSLGGLATLQALFTEPNAFRTFIVASPSIWWNNRTVLKGQAAFAAKVKAGEAHPRVMVTMGALESDIPATAPPGMPLDALKARMAMARMVDNGRELATSLRAIKGQPPYEAAEYAVFPGQNHGISAWSAISAGIAFAFQTPPAPAGR